jgi:hypothetical protein
MIWDKVFWAWFLFTAILILALLAEELSAMGMLGGSLLAGLGLAKLSYERRLRLRKDLLKRLG